MLNRASLSKYHGLLKIEIHNLNHPKWLFVSTPNQIPNEPWAEAPYGWTVRCCPEQFYEFGLPSKHMQQFTNLSSVVSELQDQLEIQVRFVIYPSWNFDVSGCCLIEYGRLTIEAVKGDIAPLLKGKVTPDVVLESEGPFFQKLRVIQGGQKLLSLQDQQFLIFSCRKIETDYTTVIEWTKTIDGQILFHDWIEFK
jgi:hypothetical protein